MSAELNPLDLVGERNKPIPTMTLSSTLVSSFATMALAMTLSTSSENLDIFDRELPDAHQQLSIQLGKDLEIFTVFNALPIELRLKIWRLAFPAPRKVDLCGDSRSRATTRKGDKLPAWKSMTVTQFINRESRAETLRHYVITASSVAWHRDRNTVDRSLCFSPARDTITFTFGDSVEELSRTDHWLKQLNTKFPGNMKGIRSLEINKKEKFLFSSNATHRVDWTMSPVASPRTTHRDWNDSTYIEPIDLIDLGIIPEHKYYLLGSGGSVLHFAGLEELRVSLTLSGFHWAYAHTFNEEIQQMERNIEVNISNCLDQNKKLFITGKAPVVEVVSFERDLKRWPSGRRRF